MAAPSTPALKHRASHTSAMPSPPQLARRGSQEPLLGDAAGSTQADGGSVWSNLFMGTAVLAQVGVWILTGIVWGGVLTKDLMLFSAHPLANSAGILLALQATLVLQPTATAAQKRAGTLAHSALNNAGLAALLAGLVVIEYNKISHGAAQFTSAHGRVGLATYIVLVLQALVGITAYFLPGVYGGVANAKSLYKYHRMSGYVLWVLLLTTVCLATQTDTVRNMLQIPLWSVLTASIITMVGVVARVKKSKMGF